MLRHLRVIVIGSLGLAFPLIVAARLLATLWWLTRPSEWERRAWLDCGAFVKTAGFGGWPKLGNYGQVGRLLGWFRWQCGLLIERIVVYRRQQIRNLVLFGLQMRFSPRWCLLSCTCECLFLSTIISMLRRESPTRFSHATIIELSFLRSWSATGVRIVSFRLEHPR